MGVTVGGGPIAPTQDTFNALDAGLRIVAFVVLVGVALSSMTVCAWGSMCVALAAAAYHAWRV